MDSINYTPLRVSIRGRAARKNKNIGILFVLLIILLAPVMYMMGNKNSPKNMRPVVKGIATERKIEVVDRQELKEVVEEALQGSKASYAVAIKNFKTGEFFYLNEHKKFLTASLYKVWVMAVVTRQIQEEKLKETDVLKQDVKILNEKFNIASEDADLEEGVVELSVKDALEKMITISDNYAALLLSEKVGISSIKNFLAQNGFTESSIGQPPTTTALDIMLFFEKLYKGKLAGAEYTEKMVNLLKNQRLNEIIPYYLPDGVIVAHKTGQLYTVAHDAGIIYTDHGDYGIVLLSDGLDILGAKERMAKISRGVYHYFRF